jgi:aminopeptidase
MDPRIQSLASNLVRYSVCLQPGENLLIEVHDQGHDLARAVMAEAYAIGGKPFIWTKDHTLLRAFLMKADKEQVSRIGQFEAGLMADMQAYIGIRGQFNVSEWADLPKESVALYQTEWWKVVHTDIRVKKTKWCVMRWPSYAMAQQCKMSKEGFEDFYFKVCCLDYAKLAAAEDPLVDLFDRTDRVHIKGPGTDLTFSIKAIPTMKSCGLRNIPDGEVFTAPVRDSLEGFITFNAPSISRGIIHENIRLEFAKGKIVKAASNHTDHLNEVLDTDEGARYTGEFAIGLNPHIHHPMGDILFDEKIAGSFHLTPGNAYDTAFNGNRSAIHWDLVAIQTPEYGGGEIWFDGVLVRKDGRFVLPELEALNPHNF